jgi:signal transduction histidine kinase
MNAQEANIRIAALEQALGEATQSRRDLEADLLNQKALLHGARKEAQDAKSDVWALDEVQQALEAVSRSGSEFVIQMDHRIRTTLNGLLGMVELLLNCDLVDEELEFASGASKSGQQLLDIMNDVLDYCRMDAGHVEFKKEEFNTADFLARLEGEFKPQAQAKGLELATDASAGVPAHITGDPELLRRALGHLVDNALRFTSEGNIEICSKVEGSGEHAQVAFYVQDSGAGIASEDVDRFCEAFESEDTGSSGGLGLGLTVVQRLVELMGGTFSLSSVVGLGTRASISFLYNSISADGQVTGGRGQRGQSKGRRRLPEDNRL